MMAMPSETSRGILNGASMDGPMTVAIRPAGLHDLAAILSLYREAGLDGGAPLPRERAEAIFARMASYPDYHLFVAELEGEIVGTFALLIMENLANRGAPSGIVEDVAVAVRHQGQGIGTAMMQIARARCASRGCYKLVLSSNARRRTAHRFYESLGFRRHGYSFALDLDPAELADSRR